MPVPSSGAWHGGKLQSPHTQLAFYRQIGVVLLFPTSASKAELQGSYLISAEPFNSSLSFRNNLSSQEVGDTSRAYAWGHHPAFYICLTGSLSLY